MMTSPIEAMVKAYDAEVMNWCIGTDRLSCRHQLWRLGQIKAESADLEAMSLLLANARRDAGMRAALLALAECELPAELFDAATQAETDVRNSKKLERRFKFLLRSIATQKGTDA